MVPKNVALAYRVRQIPLDRGDPDGGGTPQYFSSASRPHSKACRRRMLSLETRAYMLIMS